MRTALLVPHTLHLSCRPWLRIDGPAATGGCLELCAGLQVCPHGDSALLPGTGGRPEPVQHPQGEAWGHMSPWVHGWSLRQKKTSCPGDFMLRGTSQCWMLYETVEGDGFPQESRLCLVHLGRMMAVGRPVPAGRAGGSLGCLSSRSSTPCAFSLCPTCGEAPAQPGARAQRFALLVLGNRPTQQQWYRLPPSRRCLGS